MAQPLSAKLKGSPLLQQLGVQHPLFLAPMAGASTPPLVAAVSNAGGLGFYAAGITAPATLRSEIRAIKSLSPKPFGVNLFVPTGCHRPESEFSKSQGEAVSRVRAYYMSRAEQLGLPLTPPPAPEPVHAAAVAGAPASPDDVFRNLLDVVLEEGVPVLSFHFGWPQQDVVDRCKQAGVLLLGCATSVAEALYLEQRGANAIIAQGSEAGGHRGTFLGISIPDPEEVVTSGSATGSAIGSATGSALDSGAGASLSGDYNQLGMVGTLALTGAVCAAVRVPVVAAGGIMDGRGVLAALALGAQAAQLGTAFLTTTESGAPPSHKAALLHCRSSTGPRQSPPAPKPDRQTRQTPTVVTQAFTGKPARTLLNQAARDLHQVQGQLPNTFCLAPFTRPLFRAAHSVPGGEEVLPLWAGQGYAACRELPAGQLVLDIMREVEELLG
mmetsp:Transcript_36314/g.80819  ORF Transcript_36314/g.80819 Transcript_36314/m.80819 type:complete len:441 (+) Transcript_36314:245-1567(+)